MEFVRETTREPDFYRVLEGQRLTVDVPGMTEPCDGCAKWRPTDLQEHSRMGPAGPGADRRQERNWATDRFTPTGTASGRLVSDPGLWRVGNRRPAHGQRAHSRAAQPLHRQSPAAALSVTTSTFTGARRQGALPANCATCHSSRNRMIYRRQTWRRPDSHDVNTACHATACRARHGGLSNLRPDTPWTAGAEWCLPQGDWQVRSGVLPRPPRRVAEGTNALQGDVLHGIWRRRRYLHNGSVPTLGQLVCPSTRRGDSSAEPLLRRSAGRV